MSEETGMSDEQAAEKMRQYINDTFEDMILQRGAFAPDPVLDAKMAKIGRYWCPFSREWRRFAGGQP